MVARGVCRRPGADHDHVARSRWREIGDHVVRVHVWRERLERLLEERELADRPRLAEGLGAACVAVGGDAGVGAGAVEGDVRVAHGASDTDGSPGSSVNVGGVTFEKSPPAGKYTRYSR